MSDQLHCDDCDTAVSVEHRPTVGLLLTCECEDTKPRSVKTALALAEGWR